MKSLSDMLECAMELDPGSYTEDSGFMILYVIRLMVRIEGKNHDFFIIVKDL